MSNFARFSTRTKAQNYANKVHQHLIAQNPPAPEPPVYFAENWSEVKELGGGFYVPVYLELPPTTHEELVTELPVMEQPE